ncbi:Leucyl aminopeptidase yscIV [Orbilia oligospora]|nr:Leucyl aminopeptidase yscIV [Orbilia oligospora]
MKIRNSILAILASCHLISAAPTSPLVESNKLRRGLKISQLQAQATELYGIATRNDGHRAVGSLGASETIDWVYGQISQDYYNVEIQNFTFSNLHMEDTFVVDGANVAAFCYSDSGDITAPITVSAEMVRISNNGCQASDYAVAAGKIGIMQIVSGSCSDTLPIGDWLRDAGVLGLIYLTDIDLPEEVLTPGPSSTLKSRDAVDPLVYCLLHTSRSQPVLDKLQPGSLAISSTITLSRWYEEIHTANIIATTKGGNQNSVIVVGASTDSANGSPGMNDNGSGTIAQLEISKALTGFSVNNAVRFCWWGGSSPGLAGSRAYLEQLSAAEKAKIVMNLNGYMLASKNFKYAVLDGDGSSEPITFFPSYSSGLIEKAFNDFFTIEESKPSVPTLVGGQSDHFAFFEDGIPAGGITTGSRQLKTTAEAALFGGTAGQPYDACYGKPCDDLSNLNYRVFLSGTKAMAHVIAKYARDITGFPFPRPPVEIIT